jgi:hypothetical protein
MQSKERDDGVPRSEEPGLPVQTLATPAPITLLDLDGAGLDPTQPAPAEFIQFLYDNSRSSYLTLWSAKLAEPGAASTITQWINNALAVYHARALMTQMAPAGDKPAGANITEVTYGGATAPDAPVCIDVPFASGVAAVDGTLTCTMGNWGHEPTSYAYAWSSGGAESSYVVQAGDAGTSLTCVVTATNAGGSTAAPPSNAVAIPGAARAASAPEAPHAAPVKTEDTHVDPPTTRRGREDYDKRK